MSDTVLALMSFAGGVPDRPSLEALALARQIATTTGGTLEAVLVAIESDAGPAAEALAGRGVATVVAVGHPDLTADHPAAWAAAIEQIVAARAAGVVVGPGTERGNELLARVGARMALPVATNCIAVEAGDRYRLTRQRWAGSLLEECWLDAPTRLLTAAPNSIPVGEPDGGSAPPVEVIPVTLSDRDLALRVTSREAPERGKISLTDAKVVVGGGRGVGSTEGFGDLEELAALLGGAVGGSRVVTSAGWRPHADQIGQTGLRIAPDLYVACGISGAIQHIVGCKAAKHILAINTDPDAPIMGIADSAVIGDLHTIVPAISAEIRRRAASA